MTKAPSSRASIAAPIKRKASRNGPKIPTAHAAAAAKISLHLDHAASSFLHAQSRRDLSHRAIRFSLDAMPGSTWATISPDLTRNDKSKQQDSGGPLTKDQYTVEYYDVIFSLAESPKQEGVLWAGTDDGLVQLTRDGGKTWEQRHAKGSSRMGDDQPHRSLAVRCGHSVHRRRRAQARQFQALHFQNQRLRQNRGRKS